MVDYSQFEASVKSGIHADVSRIRQKDEIIKAVVKKEEKLRDNLRVLPVHGRNFYV